MTLDADDPRNPDPSAATRRMFERAAELAARADADPGDAYAVRWAPIMELLAEAGVIRDLAR